MKIITFDAEPSSRRGGQELSLVDECVGLARRGHEITLGYIREGDLLARYRDAGAATVRLSALSVDRGDALRSAAAAVSSAVRAARQPADLVMVNDYHDALLGRAVARLRRVPLVCHLRIFPPAWFSGQWRVGLLGVARFIAVSRAVADAWTTQGGCDPAAIDVVHDGVDVPEPERPDEREATRSALGVAPDAFVVLYAGRLDREKNLETLLRSFATAAVPGSRLLIAGRPVAHATPSAGESYVAELRALADALGIADVTFWLGVRTDVTALFRAADVSVLLAYNEAFGRTTVESLACGTPALVSEAGGTAEILTGEFAALRVPADDPAAVAERLRSLAQRREGDPDFAMRAREHARRNFGVAAMVTGVERSLQLAARAGRAERGPRAQSLPRAPRIRAADSGSNL